MTKVTELKNMMLDTWDGQIFFPRFYDIDTILSYDNSGEIKFDVDIEMEQGYWNTSGSRLWTKIRDYMHDELVATYKDMRANGVTYENIMRYMYNEQIARIPQRYYNMDFDIKYAPYADTYLGKAHGDGLQHMKRWLKKRFIFCDTLFDYAPSYENDVLTIRANTLNQMNLTIETYTPLYQHVSFYNGNMEKIKVKPGEPITFSGYAQTATDQEVLIYGGSNIKKITGISSCNPNSMLIGDAPRLTELDISNCPILTIVNSNKANFSPHTYLNKLNMSNCPQLGGNLNVSNSPLLQEIDARGSAITGLLMPPSLRNLTTLKLPNTLSSLTLNDVNLLHTLELDEGSNLQSISLTNCNNLTNTVNFDITNAPTVKLDNSYHTEELYMSEVTDLTLKNMHSLQRVIFTPNSEYSEFDINNVINGKSYKVTTFNNPKMTDFITTAPHRLSYNGEDVEYIEEVIETVEIVELLDRTYVKGGYWNSVEGGWNNAGQNNFFHYIINTVEGVTTYHIKTSTSIWDTQYVRCTAFNKYGSFVSNELIRGSNAVIDQDVTFDKSVAKVYFVCDGAYMSSCTCKITDTITLIHKEYGDITSNTVFTANTLDLADTQFQNVKFLCTTDIYNLKVPTTMKNFYCDSAFDIDTDVIEDASYEVIHEELIEPYTTNYEGEVKKVVSDTFTKIITDIPHTVGYGYSFDGNYIPADNYIVTDYMEVSSITTSPGVYTCVEFDKDKNKIKVTHGVPSSLSSNCVYVRLSTDKLDISVTYTGVERVTPNIIPSSANGSLIFNMYSNNTTQPTSTSPYMWDLTGLKLEDFYTYGMNNWVKKSYKDYNPTPLPFASYVHPQGSVGEKIEFIAGFDDYNKSVPLYSMHCLQVKPGETYVLNKDIDEYYYCAEYWGTTLDGTLTFIKISVSNNTVVTVPDNTDLFWIVFSYRASREYTNKEWNYIIGNGKYWWSNPSKDYTLHWDDIQTMTYEQVRDTLAIDPATVGNAFGDGTIPTPNITMPQRMPGYSVRLVNADITPDEYPTMLYPKLIDITLPITGKLDYTKYNGSSLAWAYAYTTGDVSINPLDSQSVAKQIANDYNKLYGTDYVDNEDVWAYKDTDVNKFSSNDKITKAYIELTQDNYKTRIDEVLQYYPNCTDLYFFEDGSVTSLENMYYNVGNQSTISQVENITFIEGYFNNLTSLKYTFRNCTLLKSVSNIPNSVTSLYCTFDGCTSLTVTPSIPSGVIEMDYTFRDCQKITEPPIIPSGVTNLQYTFESCYQLKAPPSIPNGVTNLHNTFRNCTSLTTPPSIPNGVTNMYGTFNTCENMITAPDIPNGVTTLEFCFRMCKLLTTAPNIPNSVTNMASCFQGCTSLTTVQNIPSECSNFNTAFGNCTLLQSVPSDGWKGNMNNCFTGCTSLNCQVNISSATGLEYTFYSCKALTITPTLPTTVNKCSMGYCFMNCELLTTPPRTSEGVTSLVNAYQNCTSLTTAPYIPSSCINIAGAFYNTKITTITIPLANIKVGCYGSALNKCSLLTDIVWEGERNKDFILTDLRSSGISQEDIQELVPEHLADLKSLGTTATLILGEYASYLSIGEILSAQAKGWTLEGNFSGGDYAMVNALTDLSAIEVNSDITTVMIELTNDNYKTRISEVYAKYPSMTDVLFIEDGTVTTLADMFNNSNNNTCRSKIKKIEFLEGYFQNLTSLSYSFYNCTALTDIINIPSSVTNMYRAFYYCGKLVNVSDFPDGVKNVNYTFYYCESLVTSPKLGKTTKELDYTFYSCENLTSIPEFPPSANKLTGTFSGCSKLNNIPKIPDTVTDMSNCFYNCTALTEAPALPANIQMLSSTFYGCSAMTKFPSIIPKTVINSSSCFYSCKKMVTPPEFEHTDGSNLYPGRMFHNCSSMTTAPRLPEGLTNIQGMFMGCSKLEVPPTIPNSVTNIQEIFNNCTSLTQNPNVPTGVTNLKYAFANSSITAITIPLANLTTYDYAISKCPNLTDVTWVGELTKTFNVKNLYYKSATDNTTPTGIDIQELVPEHLGTVTGQTLTLGDYISHLSEDEISQAVAKGWILQ